LVTFHQYFFLLVLFLKIDLIKPFYLDGYRLPDGTPVTVALGAHLFPSRLISHEMS
jgi:hypothetical protein